MDSLYPNNPKLVKSKLAKWSFSSATADGTIILSLRSSHVVLSLILTLPSPHKSNESPIPLIIPLKFFFILLSFMFPLPLFSPFARCSDKVSKQWSPYLVFLLTHCSGQNPTTCILKYCSHCEELYVRQKTHSLCTVKASQHLWVSILI